MLNLDGNTMFGGKGIDGFNAAHIRTAQDVLYEPTHKTSGLSVQTNVDDKFMWEFEYAL